MTYKELQAHVKGGTYHYMTPDELHWVMDNMDKHEDSVDPIWWQLRVELMMDRPVRYKED